MAIKKRTQQERDREARIEAFGAAADAHGGEPAPVPASVPVAPPAAAAGDRQPTPSAGEARTWPKNALIRYPNDELPKLLAEVAALEERTHHATSLRALRRGLEVLREEHLKR
ncbi:hypothetical protein GW571_15165 (plasmid) [Clavibacter capsici]|uniref:Uncharacterized protein n=1 Tax=Clavibacter capsici TaxID=1874630 RepID=A0A0M4H9N9_9MICO|nr:hypothetical protein [Clavibacter capsici]ALD14381.1 hypothetical protein AES38_14885 [Clavibacter capsici]QIS40506.1 hypothetical protein GW572_15055 [Clavibacter capsici]QIS43563.1 hypothetical protein GW571_15165 [Clavibacter capsici]QIS46500.1 hypothetical protein GW570_15065 [Clavibacter capsici]